MCRSFFLCFYLAATSMMTIEKLRAAAALLLGGLIWYACFALFFIYSGAQSVLASPDYQSSKFLKVFLEVEPLPRVVESPWLLYAGIYMVSTASICVFLFLGKKLRGPWWKKGLRFALINWALSIPWFEFYLPYNVMHEPFLLVLLEGVLWLCTLVVFSITISFIVYFRKKRLR